MKTKSAKAKGRRLAKKVAGYFYELLYDYLNSEEQIQVTPSGVTGSDLKFVDIAILQDCAIECKNQEKLNIWAAIEQAKQHAEKENKEGILVFFGKNRSPIYVAMRLELFGDFLRLLFDLAGGVVDEATKKADN